MYVEKMTITNFKGYQKKFTVSFNESMNVIVGNNEEGKTTILEALYLVLTCSLHGKPIRNELSQYLFNVESVQVYLASLQTEKKLPPPFIEIEVYLGGDGLAELEGNGNSEKSNSCGISFRIEFDENFSDEYAALIKDKAIFSIPIEYYTVNWISFARKPLSFRSVPLRTALIDATSPKYRSGSDIYINRIIKELLGNEDIVGLSQAHRGMTEAFMKHPAVEKVSARVKEATKISAKKVNISAELSSKNSWEDSLVTYIDDVPFNYIGKGEQSLIKTKLALSNNKSVGANLLLVEEPENHLSHTKLSSLINGIKENSKGKQVIITTHSSFVANKLGLDSLILVNSREMIRLKDLSPDTSDFFEKIAGYDTLRLLLCKKAVLVEGDSDELVVQRYYLDTKKRLPIEDEIDVISVGTSFLRFLEISEKLKKETVVITDNDGDIEAINKKYESYLAGKHKSIKISFDTTVDKGDLKIKGKDFNYNTLEPKIVKENGLDVMNKVLGKKYASMDELHTYMKSNKTECALRIFNSKDSINFPDYIKTPVSAL